jgi:hypothetical protein
MQYPGMFYCVVLLLLLLMGAHSYPSSYSGDLSTVDKGAAFGSMTGVANYENTYSDKCKINHNVPTGGWQENTKYSFNVTTDQGSKGLGMVYLMKYAKGTTKVSGTSPSGSNNARVEVTMWQSTILPSSLGGESFTVYAICGAGGSTKKMYVAESVKLCKAGTATTCHETPNTTPSSSGEKGSTQDAKKSDGHTHAVTLGAMFAVALLVLSA